MSDFLFRTVYEPDIETSQEPGIKRSVDRTPA